MSSKKSRVKSPLKKKQTSISRALSPRSKTKKSPKLSKKRKNTQNKVNQKSKEINRSEDDIELVSLKALDDNCKIFEGSEKLSTQQKLQICTWIDQVKEQRKDWEQLKVSDLKAYCKSQDLSSSGNKDELVNICSENQLEMIGTHIQSLIEMVPADKRMPIVCDFPSSSFQNLLYPTQLEGHCPEFFTKVTDKDLWRDGCCIKDITDQYTSETIEIIENSDLPDDVKNEIETETQNEMNIFEKVYGQLRVSGKTAAFIKTVYDKVEEFFNTDPNVEKAISQNKQEKTSLFGLVGKYITKIAKGAIWLGKQTIKIGKWLIGNARVLMWVTSAILSIKRDFCTRFSQQYLTKYIYDSKSSKLSEVAQNIKERFQNAIKYYGPVVDAGIKDMIAGYVGSETFWSSLYAFLTWTGLVIFIPVFQALRPVLEQTIKYIIDTVFLQTAVDNIYAVFMEDCFVETVKYTQDLELVNTLTPEEKEKIKKQKEEESWFFRSWF